MTSEKFKTLAFALGLCLLAGACGSDKSKDTGGDPYAGYPYPNFHGRDFHGEKNFATLINGFTEGKADPTPWAGYWWPYKENGIASSGMSSGGSPAAKYDAAHGGSTRAQEWEVKYHGSKVPKAEPWWGHCNGWCAAAALFPEPHDSATVNGITFSVADIKGLLSEAGMEVTADFFGERMDDDNPDNPKYYDTVPDQYFLVLTNYMGRLKQTVLIDRYTGYQIWNQPVAGYRFTYPTPADYLGADPSAPGVYRIMLSSKIWWMNDGVPADVQTPEFDYPDTDTDIIQSRELRMEVWLDGPVVFDSNGKITQSGNVIVTRKGDLFAGGAWRMGDGYMVDAWPDYMWIPYSMIPPSQRSDGDDPYGNPYVDIDWLKKHVLVPGGADDPSTHGVRPSPDPAPSFDPWASPTPTPAHPHPHPSADPWPWPWPEPTTDPSPAPSGGPWPFPWPHSSPTH